MLPPPPVSPPHHPEYAYSTPTVFLGSVTFRDGQVIEYTNSFAAR